MPPPPPPASGTSGGDGRPSLPGRVPPRRPRREPGPATGMPDRLRIPATPPAARPAPGQPATTRRPRSRPRHRQPAAVGRAEGPARDPSARPTEPPGRPSHAFPPFCAEPAVPRAAGSFDRRPGRDRRGVPLPASRGGGSVRLVHGRRFPASRRHSSPSAARYRTNTLAVVSPYRACFPLLRVPRHSVHYLSSGPGSVPPGPPEHVMDRGPAPVPQTESMA